MLEREEEVERDAKGTYCSCNGYADKIEYREEGFPSKEEIKALDCGRGMGEYPCCLVAFKCRLCGKRFLLEREAPEAW